MGIQVFFMIAAAVPEPPDIVWQTTALAGRATGLGRQSFRLASAEPE